MSKINLGAKYYRYVGDSLEILRVVSDKDPNSIKCSIGHTLLKKRLPLEELEREYMRLSPDGFIYFNIVRVQEIEDVMIMLYRSSDIEKNESYPYCICRQNISDLFANTIKPKYEDMICGVSVSKDTLPEGLEMNTVLACDELLNSIGICVYMDDDISDILRLFKSKDYDIVLHNLFSEHVKYKYKDNIKEYMDKRYVDGYCKTLKDLMLSNNFMYDFYMGFNIYPVDITIQPEECRGEGLLLKHRFALSSLILKNITNGLAVPYNKFIDLEKIERDYIMIQDSTGMIFIIAYICDGNYTVPVQDIETPENIQKLSKIKGYSNSSSIQNAIRFNKDKYI